MYISLLSLAALAAVANAEADARHLRRGDDRRLQASIMCITQGGTLDTCCKEPDGVCDLLTCASLADITVHPECKCGRIKSGCAGVLPFDGMLPGLNIKPTCAQVDECCLDDSTNEKYNECVLKAKEEGKFTVPNFSAFLPADFLASLKESMSEAVSGLSTALGNITMPELPDLPELPDVKPLDELIPVPGTEAPEGTDPPPPPPGADKEEIPLPPPLKPDDATDPESPAAPGPNVAAPGPPEPLADKEAGEPAMTGTEETTANQTSTIETPTNETTTDETTNNDTDTSPATEIDESGAGARSVRLVAYLVASSLAAAFI